MNAKVVVQPTKKEILGQSLWLLTFIGLLTGADALRDQTVRPSMLIVPLFILCGAVIQALKRIEVNEAGVWLRSWRGTKLILWSEAARGTLHRNSSASGWLASAWGSDASGLPVTLILFDANNETLLDTTVDFGPQEDRRALYEFVAARLQVDSASTRMTQQVFADKKRSRNIGYGFMALAFSLVLVWACFGIRSARATDIRGAHFTDISKLAKAQGTVTSSRLREMRGNGQRWNYPEIWYQFGAAGNTYESRHITFSCTGGGGADYAAEFVNKYPTGKTITVFYDPQDPTFSVLEPQIADNFLGALLLFIFAVLGAIASLVYLLRQYLTPPNGSNNTRVLAT